MMRGAVCAGVRPRSLRRASRARHCHRSALECDRSRIELSRGWGIRGGSGASVSLKPDVPLGETYPYNGRSFLVPLSPQALGPE